MQMIPIQVTEEGVFIPKVYLRETNNLEVVLIDDYVLVRPHVTVIESNAQASAAEALPTKPTRRFSFIGSGHTRNPKASIEAEEILKREIEYE
ncbi:MAG: hypothetical protein ACOYNY_05175 [Caldilineaceae bacterium]